MNKRIRELAVKAGAHWLPGDWNLPSAVYFSEKDLERFAAIVAAEKQEPVAWTARELELIDGMIQVQLDHAERCDRIANRAMADKQKGWDMERVALLQKIRATPPAAQREWVGLIKEEIDDIWSVYCDEMGYAFITDAYEIVKAIEAKLKEKNT